MRKRSATKLWAALLALSLLLSLAACGQGEKDGGGDTKDSGGASVQPLGDKVFVPETAALPTGLYNVSSAVLAPDGATMYLVDYTQETASVAHNGYIQDDYRYHCRLMKAGLDGGAAVELPGYRVPEVPEEACGAVSLHLLRANADGSVWVQETAQWYYLDVPPDFDPETDDAYHYRSETGGGDTYLLLDSEGNELRRVDLSEKLAELGQDPEDPFSSFTVSFDGEGNAYLVSNGQVHVLDKDLNVLFSLEGSNMNDGAVALADGTMAVLTYVDAGPGGGGGQQLRAIDLEAKDWGTGYPVESGVYRIYPGSGQFRFLYTSGDGLYGWDAGAEQAVKLFSWFDAGLNQDRVYLLSMLPDGRMAAMTGAAADWQGTQPPVLSLLTAVDRSEAQVSERKILTYGTCWLGTEETQQIQLFNASSSEYAIRVRDYHELSGGDYEAMNTLILTEFQTGNIPDIIDSAVVDRMAGLTQMGAKGYLEDLWPWIDGDPDFGREDLMVRPLEAASVDGKLYEAFSNFSIDTVIAPVSRVGDRLGWTLEDVIALNDSLPEDVTLLGPGMTSASMFYWAAPQVLDSFVDWETGECSFESGGFKRLLEFCALFPAEQGNTDDGYGGTYDRIYHGRQVLDHATLFRLDDLQLYPQFWGEDVACIGFPTADGSCGSAFTVGVGENALAMSASCPCKEGAWSFIRQAFLPRAGQNYYGDYLFPINKQDFQYNVDAAMTPEYETLPKGLQVEVKKHWGEYDGVPYELYAMKQEELDRLMALYDAVERMDNGRGTIYGIVSEMAGAYFAGDKSLDETCSLIQNRVMLYVNENR